MKRLLLCLALLLPLADRAHAQSATSRAGDSVFVVEHTYWLRPGRSEQFIALFKKTMLPKLQAEQKAGRLHAIRLAQPQLSSGKDQWNYRVTLVWKDRASALQFTSERKTSDNTRIAMEEQLREELVVDRTDTLVIEHDY
ncbi:MAG: hypothetical protein Q4G62_01980 [Pseudomonadota bacterium]|nr:hypothetical protein [Pseudomonadota bacterium]